MKSPSSVSLARVLDANTNRAKEGLRVCEDVCRFVLDDRTSTRQFKTIRHELTEALAAVPAEALIRARQSQTDVGRRSTRIELKRRSVKDIFYANSQRVKESLRVLEEFLKLIQRGRAERLKGLRYRVYAVEQKILMKLRCYAD